MQSATTQKHLHSKSLSAAVTDALAVSITPWRLSAKTGMFTGAAASPGLLTSNHDDS